MNDYKVVISRYNEDIEWIKMFDDYVVFNKGNAFGISEEILNHSYSLPNVGKDLDVIFRYITTNYDNLPSKIAFCQGHFQDHYNLSLLDFKERLLTLKNGYSTLNYDNDRFVPEHDNSPTFNIEYWPGKLDNYRIDYDLQTWWKEVSGEEYVQKDIIFWGCIFCVDKSLIYRRPLSFYQKLHSYFTKYLNPVETHFVERSWANIFML
jgi:hypothetical protein